jgi:hypothetical protein
MEDALRHSEAHLAKSQEIAHIGSFQWDPFHHQDEWQDILAGASLSWSSAGG